MTELAEPEKHFARVENRFAQGLPWRTALAGRPTSSSKATLIRLRSSLRRDRPAWRAEAHRGDFFGDHTGYYTLRELRSGH
ncbi:MAG: hypothetical protein HY735_02140 [Verrucomicrobia bacterium]|nr:hypothetical protein [Verrucomicrobiota bacterium]